ncbi:MAG: polymorphic toxin type 50 domain-containing protein, partial [Clostridia bacterium]
GNWTNKEKIVTEKIIGSCKDDEGEEITKAAIIHYSKNGTHIVPRKE